MRRRCFKSSRPPPPPPPPSRCRRRSSSAQPPPPPSSDGNPGRDVSRGTEREGEGGVNAERKLAEWLARNGLGS